MSALPPSQPKPSLQLKVPGAPVPQVSSAPKLKAAPPVPIPSPAPPIAQPVPPSPVPALGATPSPPPLPSPSAPALPSPGLPAPSLVTPSAPVPPSAPTPPAAPTGADVEPEDSSPKAKKKAKGTKPAKPKDGSGGVTSKPSIILLLLDILVFCGAIALSVLIFLN